MAGGKALCSSVSAVSADLNLKCCGAIPAVGLLGEL